MSQPFLSEREPAPIMSEDAEYGLFYDTETTGIPLYSTPSDDPRQPHIVSLAAKLIHLRTREIVETLDVLVKPDGWTIPDEVIAIHGITNERAAAEGIPEADAVDRLLALWRRADGKIGHAEAFDRRIVRIALKRYRSEELADEWYGSPFNDTCFIATDIMALEATAKMKATGRGNKPKKPKLSEAVLFFTGRPLEGAHNAMNDVNGCIDVFFAIRDGVRERVVLPSADPVGYDGPLPQDHADPRTADPFPTDLPVSATPIAPTLDDEGPL